MPSYLAMGIFLAILVCIPVLIRYVRTRWMPQSAQTGFKAKVLSAVAIGSHQQLVTVEVGPEEARMVLTLGVSPHSITCLHSTPMPSNPVRGTTAAGMPSTESGWKGVLPPPASSP